MWRHIIKRFIIAGTNSGCGKTTISLALMAYFMSRGFKVAPFKVGPDFIDPGHHSRITGVNSRNLDGWMLSKEYNKNCFNRFSQEFDIAVVEGVMGLFDGYDGKTEAGSTAEMAKWNNIPIILVVNAQSMARSGAAIVQGFENFDPDLNFAGVIFNKIGSERHLQYLTEALDGNVRMDCLGGIPRDQEIAIPERHLGLVTNDEHLLSKESVKNLSGLIEKNIDVDKLLKNVSGFESPVYSEPESIPNIKISDKEKVKIGVARDKAFCFYYQDNIELLESFGAEIVYFSPMEDKKLPCDIKGIYFGGGYPELFTKELSENRELLDEIKTKSRNNFPIYGECGGFMYLCSEIEDLKGAKFPMTGCLPFSLRMLTKLKALGYREITLESDSIIGKKGTTAKGHEFHYSEIIDQNKEIKKV